MDALLVLGATARLTRLVTTDDLGGMLVREPVEARVHSEHGKRLAQGLECPFCVGQWIALGVLGSYLVARRKPATLGAWRFVAGGLALNYTAAHLGVRLGD